MAQVFVEAVSVIDLFNRGPRRIPVGVGAGAELQCVAGQMVVGDALQYGQRRSLILHKDTVTLELGELLRNVEGCFQHSDLLSLGKIKRLGYV